LYRVILLYKTATSRYSKIASASIKAPETDSYEEKAIDISKTTVQKSYDYDTQAYIYKKNN